MGKVSDQVKKYKDQQLICGTGVPEIDYLTIIEGKKLNPKLKHHQLIMRKKPTAIVQLVWIAREREATLSKKESENTLLENEKIELAKLRLNLPKYASFPKKPPLVKPDSEIWAKIHDTYPIK